LKSLQIDGSAITATGFANLAAGLRSLEELIVDKSFSVGNPASMDIYDVCTLHFFRSVHTVEKH
tara:strand:- start:1795 stop:1986 length:192 start_codon:yes stop_codon:yes gene_type:complete